MKRFYIIMFFIGSVSANPITIEIDQPTICKSLSLTCTSSKQCLRLFQQNFSNYRIQDVITVRFGSQQGSYVIDGSKTDRLIWLLLDFFFKEPNTKRFDLFLSFLDRIQEKIHFKNLLRRLSSRHIKQESARALRERIGK